MSLRALTAFCHVGDGSLKVVFLAISGHVDKEQSQPGLEQPYQHQRSIYVHGDATDS